MAKTRPALKRQRLTREEKEIEAALERGEYRDATPEEFAAMAAAVARKAAEIRARRKDAILHIRINGQDLARIKELAAEQGVPYQTFVAEYLHQLAR